MKKSILRLQVSIICISLIATLALAGCSSANKEKPKQDQSAAQEQTKTAEKSAPAADKEKAEKKKIVFWHIQSTGNGPKIIQNSVDRFKAENPNVEVEVVPLQNDPFKTKLKVAMGAGNPPDIFPTWSGGPLYEYVKAGQVADLTDMMNKDNYKDYFLDGAISMVTFDNKIWGVPVENIAVAGIFYNKKIFEENGLSIPKTYNELVDIVKKLKAKGITPFALANKTKWTGSMYYMYLVDRIGGPDVFKKAATRTGGTFEDEAFVKAGQMVQELVKLGAFSDGYNGLDYDTGQSRTLMYSGKAAMELMGTWNIFTVKSENEKFYNENLDFFPFPAVEGGKGDPNNVVGTVGDNFYSISKKSKNPEDAFKVIQFLIDEESVKERAADGKIPPIKGFKPENPLLQRVMGMLEKAPSVQLWYDQYLPPELGELHKDTCQALFGLSMTPEEVAKKMEEGAKKFFGK
ncbi:extracellular solute-binding protein [Petroclostridium xylanilyticum]|uniref:extracellular solute-binding protein n=1 Tax=Petroclostridium xylanilyticum TaxID=1792311 RepID=UPI001FA895E6|nr:extracellular solute-binding protein [Petroclostridium xylanilyticum]